MPRNKKEVPFTKLTSKDVTEMLMRIKIPKIDPVVVNARKIIPRKAVKYIHPLTPAIDYITEHMGGRTRDYWMKEARKKSKTLRTMVANYIVGDFQLKDKYEVL
jgi:hypothetical protein